MRTYIKLGLTALIAAMLLASAVSTAAARNLEFSTLRFRVTWSNLEFQTGSLRIRCQITLEGSFHSRTIAKVERLLIGAITRINIKEEICVEGRVRPAQAPPWHLTYEGFTGTLPSIVTVRFLLQRFQFLTEVAGVNCKFGTAVDNLTFSGLLNGAMEWTNLVPLTGRNIAHLLEGSLLCPTQGTLVASNQDGVVTFLETALRIRIRLI